MTTKIRLRLRKGAALAMMVLGGICASAQQDMRTDAARGPGHPIAVIHTGHAANSAAARKAPYVVLVSLDGFRWDYATRDHATHLLELGRKGVWAPEGMMPSYPSLTFPNHYAIVTGLYPEHNGLVANSFYDEQKQARYAISDARAVTDGSWYSGTPLWSLAESQGMRTACLFWPGSEAKIAGEQPSEYLRFDDKVDELDRVGQVGKWLREPEETRPHFITLYLSDVDHAGHSFGPDAEETRAAVARVDAIVGRLQDELRSTDLPVDLVVVSDHGMVALDREWVTLADYADLAGFETDGALLYGKTEADRQRVYLKLRHASEKFEVYRLKDVPQQLHYNENAREGDPVIVPTGPYAIRAHAPTGRPDAPPIAGAHGFDPHRMPEMKASFFAAGPDIVAGATVKPFENVNLYPWLAHMLGLKAPASDGNLNVLAGTLRDHGETTKEP